MAKVILILLALSLGLPVARGSDFETEEVLESKPESKPDVATPAILEAPKISAKSWIVYDFESGKILAEENPAERLQPASVTKVMTAYLTLRAIRDGRLKWEEKVEASKDVRRLERAESKMYLFPREKVKVRDLFRGLVIVSANDAAITLAERIGGTQKGFIEMMNATAKEIGMKDSNFATPSGMTNPENLTTARDLLVLARRLTEEFPIYYDYARETSFRYKGYVRQGRREILRYDPFSDGIKNGFTSAAGHCTLASSSRPDQTRAGASRRLIAVILGAPSSRERFRGARQLFDFGFRTISTAASVSAANLRTPQSKLYLEAEQVPNARRPTPLSD